MKNAKAAGTWMYLLSLLIAAPLGAKAVDSEVIVGPQNIGPPIATLTPAQTHAAQCRTLLAPFFVPTDRKHYRDIELVGALVYSDWDIGEGHAFSMSQFFSLDTDPIGTPGAAFHEWSHLGLARSDLIQGDFSVVFPGRRNHDIDHTRFNLTPAGELSLVLLNWGGTVQTYSLECLAGTSDDVVVLIARHESTVWTFVLTSTVEVIPG